MYKTIWLISFNDSKVKLTFYHFGKTPKFPTWYMDDKAVYTVEMLWNFKVVRPSAFLDCLFHTYKVE